MNQKEFGELIAKKRKEKNLTQNELSEKLGVSSYKTISKWENGIYMPDISLLTSISEVLDISLYELLGGKQKSNMIDKEVNDVLKDTINKVDKKNKTLKIFKIISIILIIILITISTLFAIEIYKKNDYLFTVKPQGVELENLSTWAFNLDNQSKLQDNFFTTRQRNNNYLGIEEALCKNLPLYKTKNGYTYISPADFTLVYRFSYNNEGESENDINKSFKDKYYTKKSMLINSVVLFSQIGNLENIRFIYKNIEYNITSNIMKEYFIFGTSIFSDVSSERLDLSLIVSKQKDFFDKLNNQEFLDSFFTKCIVQNT